MTGDWTLLIGAKVARDLASQLDYQLLDLNFGVYALLGHRWLDSSSSLCFAATAALWLLISSLLHLNDWRQFASLVYSHVCLSFGVSLRKVMGLR